MTRNDNPWVKLLNMLVLLSSILILVILSIELLSPPDTFSERFILNLHLIVCSTFLVDFFIRWYDYRGGWRFLGRNIFLLLVSVPYLNIVYTASLPLSHPIRILFRLLPIARGIYGVSLIVGWMTRSKITNLFTTYLTMLLTSTYFCSIMFYFIEHGPNPMVKNYWDAFNWSLMNVTTVGSNIFGVTKLGQSLAVVLAASGMIFFPIFTAFVVNKFQKKRKESENR